MGLLSGSAATNGSDDVGASGKLAPDSLTCGACRMFHHRPVSSGTLLLTRGTNFMRPRLVAFVKESPISTLAHHRLDLEPARAAAENLSASLLDHLMNMDQAPAHGCHG